MLVARFFIYRCKYSKLKPNMLECSNLLNMIKIFQYRIAKRNNYNEHYKKQKFICRINCIKLTLECKHEKTCGNA